MVACAKRTKEVYHQLEDEIAGDSTPMIWASFRHHVLADTPLGVIEVSSLSDTRLFLLCWMGRICHLHH